METKVVRFGEYEVLIGVGFGARDIVRFFRKVKERTVERLFSNFISFFFKKLLLPKEKLNTIDDIFVLEDSFLYSGIPCLFFKIKRFELPQLPPPPEKLVITHVVYLGIREGKPLYNLPTKEIANYLGKFELGQPIFGLLKTPLIAGKFYFSLPDWIWLRLSLFEKDKELVKRVCRLINDEKLILAHLV